MIDQTRCIGCHACTTACKSENDVALGVFRTWVKNVDVGTFPAVRRHFAVLRCNHCEDAPCVEICPVTAMYQRPDGVVDFDEDRCIGCKACMQACPYDAIYMDPDSHTAAKCNFCSHRVDEGLLPACVVVCPVEALLFGDMDDDSSRVAQALATHTPTVRRPEQRTNPKTFYLGAHEAALDPLAARHGPMYMWADRVGEWESGRVGKWESGKVGKWEGSSVGANAAGAASRSPTLPVSHSPTLPPARVAYDIPRQRTWGWKVSSYIWTKSLAAGLALVPAVTIMAGGDASAPLFARMAPALALCFLALTGALLVADLKRPERFWMILVRPQWRSWLARGAFVITAYGGALALWAPASWVGSDTLLRILAWPVAVLALLTAVYTAFLFGQCEGRDLWQSPILFLHLGVHAPVAALAALFVVAPAVGAGGDIEPFSRWLITGLITAAVLAVLDAQGSHPTANAAAAARALFRGPQAAMFWLAQVGGAMLPATLLATGDQALFPLAGALALAGLWLYGHALVLAGQGPPIS